MKVRYLVAALFAAMLAVAATTASGGTSKTQADKITVWLQVDAQDNWPQAVALATRNFKAQHPNVDVDVQYQTWNSHLAKFDAALAGGDAPDVIEMGNTEMTKYMAAGAFKSLSQAAFPNNKTWLQGLTGSCRYNGKLYGVPYYAGARAVIYRKDQYRAAGIKGTPTTLNQFVADGKKLMKKYGKDSGYSAVYFPGKNWYASMAFVYDYGAQIAVRKGGKWQGTLNSPKALGALTRLKSIVTSLSRASKTTDEANPQQALVFAKGKVGSFIGNGWEWPYALDEKLGNPGLAPVVGAYPMPSHTKGKFMPTFLGGSDLAVPTTTKNQALAVDWIKAFTSTAAETEIAKAGNIANTTKLLALNATNPKLAPFAKAAKYSWFVPTSPNWANVENADVLQNMLVKIFTGRASVKAAANSASSQITRILNSGA
ncbi:MAG TPA: extracellular solute-binding protein [Gaiellaceae bacterium]|jgi:N,N'-diacetylchitobiose transport system substrate-binding protein